MNPSRWYYLRHPNGFDDEMFECFVASCHLWQSEVEAMVRVWRSLPLFKSSEPPTYSFGVPARAEVPNAVVFPVGSEGSYLALKVFEDEFPQTLYGHFIIPFCLALEKGRRDTLGFYPEIQWMPAHPQLAPGMRRRLLDLVRRCERWLDPTQMTTRRLRKLLRQGAVRRGEAQLPPSRSDD